MNIAAAIDDVSHGKLQSANEAGRAMVDYKRIFADALGICEAKAVTRVRQS